MMKIGSKENPYMYDQYCNIINPETQSGETWNGGWVIWTVDCSKEKLVYVTKNEEIEEDTDEAELGSIDNPFSYTAYLEMYNYGTWIGGYVLEDEDDDPVYYRSSEDTTGCGSGSGSGTGSGSGSGGAHLTAGSSYATICNLNLIISWGEGSFDTAAIQKPSISARLAEVNVPNTINCSWVRNYEVMIVIEVHGCTSTGYYSIPGAFRH